MQFLLTFATIFLVYFTRIEVAALISSSQSPIILPNEFENEATTTSYPEIEIGEVNHKNDYEEEKTVTDNDRESSSNFNTNSPSPSYTLVPGYNKLETPKFRIGGIEIEGTTTQVLVNLTIRSIADINEKDEEISFDMELSLGWRDYGIECIICQEAISSSPIDENDEAAVLASKRIKSLDPSLLNNIWKPDIFIQNIVEIKQPTLIGKSASLKLQSNQLVIYKSRFIVKVKCGFEFDYYPADTLKCDLLLRSYSYNSDVLELIWTKPIGLYLKDPSDSNYDVAVGSVRRFQIETTNIHGGDDLFHALQFTIYARRKLSYHIWQTYIPSMLYIAITWLCFMIPKEMIEARLAIAMTTLLTLTSMFSSVRDSTPTVSYTKAIDIWMVSCVAFVFCVLVEFAVILWVETTQNVQEDRALSSGNEVPDENGKASRSITEIRRAVRPSSGGTKKFLLKTLTTLLNFIEHYSFVLILLLFIIFNTIYWTWLLIGSGYFKWVVDPTFNNILLDNSEFTAENIKYELPLYKD